MSFEDFAQSCGVSTPSPMSNGHSMFYFHLNKKQILLFRSKTTTPSNEIE